MLLHEALYLALVILELRHLNKASPSYALTSCSSMTMNLSQASSFYSPPLPAEVLYWHEYLTNTQTELKSSHLDPSLSATP